MLAANVLRASDRNPVLRLRQGVWRLHAVKGWFY